MHPTEKSQAARARPERTRMAKMKRPSAAPLADAIPEAEAVEREGGAPAAPAAPAAVVEVAAQRLPHTESTIRAQSTLGCSKCRYQRQGCKRCIPIHAEWKRRFAPVVD